MNKYTEGKSFLFSKITKKMHELIYNEFTLKFYSTYRYPHSRNKIKYYLLDFWRVNAQKSAQDVKKLIIRTSLIPERRRFQDKDYGAMLGLLCENRLSSSVMMIKSHAAVPVEKANRLTHLHVD